MRVLDLFCGRWGWSRAFAARGWECVGVDWFDLNEADKPAGATFICADVLKFWATEGWVHRNNEFACIWSEPFDFICASSPCEQFSVHCMKFLKKKIHPYPDSGIELFNHTRRMCEQSRLPYVMENVRCAEQFVGRAQAHAGSFYLWGNAIPPLLPKRLIKMGNQGGYTKRGVFVHDPPGRRQSAAKSATIPPELANCVAEYAERLWEQRRYELQCMEDPSAHAQEGKSYRR